MRNGSLSAREARWLAIAAQGLGRERPATRVAARHLRSAVGAVGVVQLDAIRVLERTQYVVLFSRVGPYDTDRLLAMSAPGGELFECAGYRAAVMPFGHHPLLRWRTATYGVFGDSPTGAGRWESYHRANADYIAAVLAEVTERGPLSASALRDPRRRTGGWWERRSGGRRALEILFARGELAAWRSASFERIYDLPERVLPPSVLGLPTPTAEEAQRGLLVQAADALGVATVADLAGYHLLRPTTARARVAELVEAQELIPVKVEGWAEPGYLRAGARVVRPSRSHATLLSPFDSLIWDRGRTRRLFGFDYRIEVYVPEAKRRHGYYVLPLLVDDRLVARFDLKADRRNSTLRVLGAFMEPSVNPATAAQASTDELRSLADWLGLEKLAVEGRGDLAPRLRRLVMR